MSELLSFLSSGNSSVWAFAVFVIGLIFFAVGFISFFAGTFVQRRRDYADLDGVRRDAIKRSRAVIGGQVGEQVAPFLPNFPCNPADVRFVGKPVDFVAFPGAADGGEISELLIIEVKTGNAQLSKREREIKDAVEGGRVRYVVYRC